MTPKTKSAHSLPAKSVLTLIGDVEIYNPKYLIDGIIEESSLVGLIGPSGAGKTFVALDMALSMATGKDYHGLFAKKGLAILSAGEGHLGIPRRVEAWCEYYEKSLELLNKDGLIIIDNVLWHGEVADEKNNDKFTVNIREFNKFVSEDKRVEQIIIPLGDGMTVCRVL